MNTIPFINTNGLWKLDRPALMDPIMPATNQLILIVGGISSLLFWFSRTIQDLQLIHIIPRNFSLINPKAEK